MTGHLRAGALAAMPVTVQSVARFPWFPRVDGVSREVTLNAGDSVHVDQAGKMFQQRQADGRVWTISARFDCIVDPDDGLELEFRTADGRGPLIDVQQHSIRFEKRNYAVSSADMFQRACQVIASPVWNPFGYAPNPDTITSHKVDFMLGVLLGPNGERLEDSVPALPAEMIAEVPRSVSLRDIENKAVSFVPGIYRCNPVDNRDFWMVRVESFEGDAALIGKQFLSVREFTDAVGRRDIILLDGVRFEQFPLWDYVV